MPNDTKIEVSCLKGIIASLIFVLMGIVSLGSNDGKYFLGIKSIYIDLLCIVFFGFIFLWMTYRNFISKKPAIIISDRGIYVGFYISINKWLEWPEITSITLTSNVITDTLWIKTTNKTYSINSFFITFPRSSLAGIIVNNKNFIGSYNDETITQAKKENMIISYLKAFIGVILFFVFFLSPLFFEKYLPRSTWLFFVPVFLMTVFSGILLGFNWYFWTPNYLDKNSFPFRYFFILLPVFLLVAAAIVAYFKPSDTTVAMFITFSIICFLLEKFFVAIFPGLLGITKPSSDSAIKNKDKKE